jgi:hypothetical protein
MPPLTKWFGITTEDSERYLDVEADYARQIVEKVLTMQAASAAKQKRGLCRGTHAKGIAVRARFEVFDVKAGRDSALGAKLAKGIFASPAVYDAVVRFGNADPSVNSDFKPDVRSLSFSVDLSTAAGLFGAVLRQDFSMQNATTLPLNDVRTFLATMTVLAAKNQAKALLSLSFRDQLRVARTVSLVQMQSRQPMKPYQKLRYWSTVPFSHGAGEFVKQSLTPQPANPGVELQKDNPNAQQDELRRHLTEDKEMSSFDFGLQLLDATKMTYREKPQDRKFWIENASVEWDEMEAPFHTLGRLRLLPRSELSSDESEAIYFDVTGNATSDSAPVGSINRARQLSEMASRRIRLQTKKGDTLSQCPF